LNWFLDFDDTLVKGGMTWILEYGIPKLIDEHQLPYDQETFLQAIASAQDEAVHSLDSMAILRRLFKGLGWHDPRHYYQLLQDMQENYYPVLFEDTLVFLEYLHVLRHNVYIISNSLTAPRLVNEMELTPYIREVFTPGKTGGTQRKPHRSIWDFIVANHPVITPETSRMVGNNPWTDGAFADNCGLSFWLLDRMYRFTDMDGQEPYRRVSSLIDIPVET
jgi:FMN phosphatase YigB (HAD superfamily)